MSDLIVDFAHQRQSFASTTKTKSVKFSPVSSMLVYKQPDEIDKANMWLTSVDYQSYKTDRLQSIRGVILANKNANDDFYVSMMNGLENVLTSKIIKKVYSTRKHRSQRVLREQARQRDAGIDDPEMIASVSRYCSEWSVKRAQQVGSVRGS